MTSTAHRAVPAAPPTSTCSCGASIRTVRIVSGPARGTTIPVDVDRDPDGILAAARDGHDWGVRILPADQRNRVTGHRYSPHWTTCPAAAQYADLEHAVAPGTIRQGADAPNYRDRSGPCGRCRKRHPNRYGPAGTPLCDACRAQPGRPLVATARTSTYPHDQAENGDPQ
jgi:hypothetical protein